MIATTPSLLFPLFIRRLRESPFDLELPLDQVADGYRGMDGRRAIKTEADRR
jgi:hypothetical protein